MCKSQDVATLPEPMMAKALNELVEVVLKTIEVATVLLAACFCTPLCCR